MKNSDLFRFIGLLALFGSVCFCPTQAVAASLTVCGIIDGSLADSDGMTNGMITTTCPLGSEGSFTGTVKEITDPLNYTIFISGDFHGRGSSSSFVSGQFSLLGKGGLYPFIEDRGQLIGGVGDVASSSDSFKLEAGANNFQFGQPSVTVGPLPLGAPLPVFLSNGKGNVIAGSFKGMGTLTLSVDYSAGSNDYYSLQAVGIASTDPHGIIPEPSTLLPVGCVVVGLILRRKPKYDIAFLSGDNGSLTKHRAE